MKNKFNDNYYAMINFFKNIIGYDPMHIYKKQKETLCRILKESNKKEKICVLNIDSVMYVNLMKRVMLYCVNDQHLNITGEEDFLVIIKNELLLKKRDYIYVQSLFINSRNVNVDILNLILTINNFSYYYIDVFSKLKLCRSLTVQIDALYRDTELIKRVIDKLL